MKQINCSLTESCGYRGRDEVCQTCNSNKNTWNKNTYIKAVSKSKPIEYKLSRKQILIDIFNRQKMNVEEFDYLRNLMLLKK